ncbi:hypothetical protein, partial [Sphingomonas sp.]|uniref:hypothetical protein n=1 Tax=Sphingomonas sp. TaxID=28214 RepID=UPI001ECBEE18
VGPEYRNRADVRLDDGTTIDFHPIFYGRPGTRMIGSEPVTDGNAFEEMFAVPREHWIETQATRLDSMQAVTACLEALGEKLTRLRIAQRR